MRKPTSHTHDYRYFFRSSTLLRRISSFIESQNEIKHTRKGEKTPEKERKTEEKHSGGKGSDGETSNGGSLL
jgi:hypothetical protein